MTYLGIAKVCLCDLSLQRSMQKNERSDKKQQPFPDRNVPGPVLVGLRMYRKFSDAQWRSAGSSLAPEVKGFFEQARGLTQNKRNTEARNLIRAHTHALEDTDHPEHALRRMQLLAYLLTEKQLALALSTSTSDEIE